MITNLFLCLIVLVEALVVPVFLLNNAYSGEWINLIGCHIILSVAIGWLGARSLSTRYQEATWGTVGFLIALAIFIPMFGAVGVLTLVLLAFFTSKDSEKTVVRQLGERRFATGTQDHDLKYGSGDPQSNLATQTMPTTARLNSLGKLQALASPRVNSFIRGALQDEIEEIRLVAFGILDKKEKAISARINQETELYNGASDPETQAEHARQLAYAYWELVYADLVQGDLLTHVLDQAKHYAAFVVRIHDQDAGMWALLGQIHLRLQDLEQAYVLFDKALESGIPRSRAVPYLAELAFHQGDYSGLRGLFSEKKVLSEMPFLQPVVEYWNGKRP